MCLELAQSLFVAGSVPAENMELFAVNCPTQERSHCWDTEVNTRYPLFQRIAQPATQFRCLGILSRGLEWVHGGFASSPSLKLESSVKEILPTQKV
jgi:hypothetical protein